METTKRIVIVFVLSLLITGTATPAESQISNTRQASCIVKIIANPVMLPLDYKSIESLMKSSVIEGKTISEILELSPKQQEGISITVVPLVGVSTPSDTANTFLFELSVLLPDSVKPVAEEFSKALAQNLEGTLFQFYISWQRDEFGFSRKIAERNLKICQSNLEQLIEKAQLSPKFSTIAVDTDAIDIAVYEQLEQLVDLSQLNPAMPFEFVLNEIKNSVAPPLQIQPNWRDLLDNAEVDRTTAADMDPLTGIRLGKALELLLAGLSSELAQISYVIEGGVIIIATEKTLPGNMVTVVYDISGLIPTAGSSANIIHAIQETIEPVSWYEISEDGEGSIVPVLGNRLTIYQTPQIHLKIQAFLESIPIEISVAPIEDVPVDTLQAERQQYSREKLKLDMDIARLEARKKAIEEQIAKINDTTPLKIIDDTIIAELQKMLERQFQDYQQIKKVVEAGRGGAKELMEIEEQISRTRIEIAQRREELGKSLGGEQLTTLNNDLSMVMIDLAEKKAEFQVIDTQLGRIESQTNAASISDPVILEIRQARQALDRAENRLNELNMMEENMQPPTVTIIGLD